MKYLSRLFIVFLIIGIVCMPAIASSKGDKKSKTKAKKEIEPVVIEYQSTDKFSTKR